MLIPAFFRYYRSLALMSNPVLLLSFGGASAFAQQPLSDVKPVITSEPANVIETAVVPSTASDRAPSALTDLASPVSNIQRLGDNQIYTGSPWFASSGARRKRAKSQFDVELRSAVEYNDNLFLDEKNPEDEIVASFSPKLSLNYGDFANEKHSYLSLSYNPAAIFYLGKKADDSVDHLFDLRAAYRMAKLSLPVTFQAKKQTNAFVELGARETLLEYGGTAGAVYQVSGKTSLGLVGNYRESDYETFSDFSTYGAEAFLGYKVSEKTNLALVLQQGVAKSDGTPKQDFQNYLVRGQTLSGKLSLTGELGLSHRRLDVGQRNDPIFRVGVGYRASERSQLALEGYRVVTNSAFTAGAGYVATGLRASIAQEIGDSLSLDLAAGYEKASYFRSTEGLSADREDEYLFISSAVHYHFNQDWSADLFYVYADNDSSDPTLQFGNQRVGLGMSWNH